MISFRYHVVSIVAILLALAAGVALGGGPLSEIGRAADDKVQGENQELAQELEQAELVTSFQDEFATDLSGRTARDTLTGHRVAVVTLPGADAEVVKSLTKMVETAGAGVPATYAITPTMIEPGSKSLVDTLGARLVEGVRGSGVSDNATTYDRMGQLLGRAIGSTEVGGGSADAGAREVLSSLSGAELLTRSSGAARVADLVLVVLGDEPSTDGTEKIVGSLLAGTARTTRGVVVAGDTATGADGLLKDLRGVDEFTAEVSSVDSAQTPTGRLSVVLALADAQRPGQYGASGKDGALPRG